MNRESFTFHSGNILVFMWRKRLPLLILTGIAIVVSAVISLFITPRFEAKVVLFPSLSASVSESLVSSSEFATNELLAFGEEPDVERILQMEYSDPIRQTLIDRFGLYSHYAIAPDSKYPTTELYSKMDKNISFRKTEYMSVEIRVLDTDPQFAADMANTIASLIDSSINNMQREKARRALQLVESEYKKLKSEVYELEDSIRASGKPGPGAEEFLKSENERLSALSAKYLQARVDAEQDLPHTFVVSKAMVPEKKAYPKRSLIVLSAAISTFVLALLLLAFLEGIRNLSK